MSRQTKSDAWVNLRECVRTILEQKDDPETEEGTAAGLSIFLSLPENQSPVNVSKHSLSAGSQGYEPVAETFPLPTPADVNGKGFRIISGEQS